MPGESVKDGPGGARQQVLLVTGLLGAGKTTALKLLEDIGWETIDNFPVRLLPRLIDSPDGHDQAVRAPLAIGFDSRTRGFDPQGTIDLVKRLFARRELELTTLFLDCTSAELERRYNETTAAIHWPRTCRSPPASAPSANCSSRCGAGPTW